MLAIYSLSKTRASEDILIKKVNIEPYSTIVFSRNDFLKSIIR